MSLIHQLISSTNITIVSQVDMTAVARHYGISTNAAQLRLRRVNDYVAKMVSAREAAQKSDEVPKDDEDLDVTTEDEDA